MKKNWKMYVILIFAYLITLYVVRTSAYNSLELCQYNPELVENSMFIKLATGR